MEKATISQLKNQLSAYLRKVRAGATVLILDRDEPIARLERVERTGEDDERLARLEKAGIIRRASRPLDPTRLRKGLVKPRRSVVEALLEEREQDR